MRSITVNRTIPATPGKIWAVLADYPNIATWNRGVVKSFSTSDSTSGVGAQRHCDLAPFGALEETIKEWDPGRRLVVSIDSASRLPLTRGMATFVLAESDGATEVSLKYDYQPRLGVVGQLMGRLILDDQFVKGFKGFLLDLERASVKEAKS